MVRSRARRGAGWRQAGLLAVVLLASGLLAPATELEVPAYDAALVGRLVAESKEKGDSLRGAAVFAEAKFACISCHKVGQQGGVIGPDLSAVGRCLTPDQIVESVFWPTRLVKPEYNAVVVATTDGRTIQGYREAVSDKEMTLRVAATGEKVQIAKADIEGVTEQGTLMPAALAASLDYAQRWDLIRFLTELGREHDQAADTLIQQAQNHAAATFPYDREPLRPELWPNRRHEVNRERLYDWYAKEAEYFRKVPIAPPVLPPYPGLDGGAIGHWGNQTETTWSDSRWNETDLGSLLCGVFRGAGLTVPKAVCVRLGDRGEMAVCFNPQTLRYEALWQGGFVKFASVRHGFLGGLLMDGTALPRPESKTPAAPFVYHGFYRHGNRVVFAYRIGDTEMLDAPWVEDGKFQAHLGTGGRPSPGKLDPGGTRPVAASARDTGHPGRHPSLRDRHHRAAV